VPADLLAPVRVQPVIAHDDQVELGVLQAPELLLADQAVDELRDHAQRFQPVIRRRPVGHRRAALQRLELVQPQVVEGAPA
jgi:hypothetical protein